MSTKFLHYRNITSRNGRTQIEARGGTTIAYVEGENGFTYAVAYCNDKDNYNRKYGNAKAAGRLLSNDPTFGPHTFKGSRDEFFRYADRLGSAQDQVRA